MDKQATLGGFAKNMGGHIAQGVGVGIATGAAAGVGLAAHKVYEALTKGRDFRAMMKNPFNQDLKEMHDANPANFNAAFTGLRQANPEMSANPMVAGTYMRRLMTYSPDTAGGYLIEARSHRADELHPLHDAFQRGAIQGVQMANQKDLERFKAENQQRVKEEARPKELSWLQGLHRAGLKG